MADAFLSASQLLSVKSRCGGLQRSARDGLSSSCDQLDLVSVVQGEWSAVNALWTTIWQRESSQASAQEAAFSSRGDRIY